MASSPSPSPTVTNASAAAAAAPASSQPSTTTPPPTTASSSQPPPSTPIPSSRAPTSQPNATPADPSAATPPASSPPPFSPTTASPPPATPQTPASPPPSPPATAPPHPSPLQTPPVVPASPPPSSPAALPPPPPSVAPPKPLPIPSSPSPPDASPPLPPTSPLPVPPPSPPTHSPVPPVVQSPPQGTIAPPRSPRTPRTPRTPNVPDQSPPRTPNVPDQSPPRTPNVPDQSPPLAPPPSGGSAIPSSGSPLPPNGGTTDPSPDSPSHPLVPPAPGDSPLRPLRTPATAADPANPNESSSPGPPSNSGGLTAGAIAGIGVVLAILVLCLVGATVWYRKKRKRTRNGYHAGFVMPSPLSSPQTLGDSEKTNYSTAASPGFKESMSDINMSNCRFFTYEELYQITNGLSAQNLLGEGGFGSVYKGCLPDGREVAVKQLKDGSGQGEREFHAEVEIISRVHHRHLVSLVGYCIANNQRLLVYDFVPNNTLHYHLHGRGLPVLEWSARVKIAAGAARGIAYLHEDCHPRIIHRDIKSSNILLDNKFEAQVADFGLARLALDAATHVTTRVMGTFGYLAPEYASSGKLTERSDVFSFGVVLLELITGRKPVDASRPLGDESLVEWARPLLTQALETGNLGELVDPRLEKNFNEVEMFRMIEAAAACVRHSASRRPRMSQVVRVLDSLADVDLTNGVQPGKSELFNMANTAEIRLFQQMAFGSQDYSCDFSQSSWDSRSRDAVDRSSSRLL